MNNPIYIPPTPGAAIQQAQAPEVVMWARIYAGALGVLYLVVIVLGAFLAIAAPTATTTRGMPVAVEGMIFVCVGICLAIPSFIALGGGRKKWVWTLNVVLMALGCTSCMCLPFAIPLLIAWN